MTTITIIINTKTNLIEWQDMHWNRQTHEQIDWMGGIQILRHHFFLISWLVPLYPSSFRHQSASKPLMGCTFFISRLKPPYVLLESLQNG